MKSNQKAHSKKVDGGGLVLVLINIIMNFHAHVRTAKGGGTQLRITSSALVLSAFAEDHGLARG